MLSEVENTSREASRSAGGRGRGDLAPFGITPASSILKPAPFWPYTAPLESRNLRINEAKWGQMGPFSAKEDGGAERTRHTLLDRRAGRC